MLPAEQLLIHTNRDAPDGMMLDVGRKEAGWDFVSLKVLKLAAGERKTIETGTEEICLVPLVGSVSATVGELNWDLIRPGTAFDGKPSSLYVGINQQVDLAAEQECEVAITASQATESFPVRFIPPEDVAVEIRGAGNACRQISHIIKPEFPAQNLLVVEVFTPSGNWSSYPPHKHDVDNMPHECNIEEIYYYRMSHPDGFALQRLYTADGSFDHAWVIKDGDLLLVTEGYHAFAVAQGYTAYYLNILAGPGDFRSMQPSDDPAHAWVRATWNDEMNEGLSSWSDIESRVNGPAGKR